MFEAPAHRFDADLDYARGDRVVDFRTAADPEAGWALRNPDRAMAFLFVSPRPCGAAEELLAA
jgi:hypothetical protein